MSVCDIRGYVICPNCNQKKISAWYFDSDCRGNPSISGADNCSNCGFVPTKDFISSIYDVLWSEKNRSK